MSKCKNSVFVAALLYSNAKLENEFEQNLLTCVLATIRKDEILSQSLHTVCIDNAYSRDVLRYNQSGVKVYSWPVFAVKYPGHEKPIIYSLSSANQVFEEVYDAYKKFRLSQGRPVPEDKPPEIPCPEEKISPCSNKKDCPSGDCRVNWNVHCFPHDGSGEINYVEKNSLVLFKSTDRSTHDLVQTDCNWEILSDPEVDYRKCRRVDFEETVLFDEVGTFYFICTVHPKRMRLIVIVTCEEEEEKKQTITKKYQYVREYPHTCGRKRHVTRPEHQEKGGQEDFSLVVSSEDADRIRSLIDDLLTGAGYSD